MYISRYGENNVHDTEVPVYTTTEDNNGKITSQGPTNIHQLNIQESFTLYAPMIGTDAEFSYQDEVNTTDNLSDLGEDYHHNKIAVGKNFPTSIPITVNSGNEQNGTYVTGSISNVERGAGIRYGNISNVRMEIRYGTDDSLFRLKKVYIDYIKAP
jgi:hypothetical protein